MIRGRVASNDCAEPGCSARILEVHCPGLISEQHESLATARELGRLNEYPSLAISVSRSISFGVITVGSDQSVARSDEMSTSLRSWIVAKGARSGGGRPARPAAVLREHARAPQTEAADPNNGLDEAFAEHLFELCLSGCASEAMLGRIDAACQ